MSSPVARALRDNHVVEVDSKDLVPGDIVLLEAGDVVPADMRLLEANSLKIEEALTGESVPVDKDLSAVLAEDAPIGDRVNMAYQNSNVTYGRGLGVVTNTGMYTEVGHIAGMLANADETDTPLKQNLHQLSKVLTYAVLVILCGNDGCFSLRTWRRYLACTYDFCSSCGSLPFQKVCQLL